VEKPLTKSGTLIIILASLAGLALTLFSASNGINALKAKSWPTTEGTVTSSQVEWNSKYVPKVIYTYTINTEEFTSNRIRLTNFAHYKKKEDAAKVSDKYPVDSKVTVYYNPNKPDEAILDPGIKGEHVFMFLIGLLIFLAPLIGLIYTIRKSRESV